MISYQKNRQLVFEISTITSKLFFCFYSGVWSKQKTPAGESPLSIEAKCMNQSKRYICLQATPLKLEVWLAPSKPDDHVYARMRKHWRLQAGDCFVRGPCWVQVEGPSTHHKVCLMFLPFTARSSLTTWISTSFHASIRHKPPFRARGYRFLRCRRQNRQHKENDADFFLPKRYAKIRYNEAAL